MRASVNLIQNCQEPSELICEVTLQPVDTFPGVDAAIIFRISWLFLAMDWIMKMIEARGPVFSEKRLPLWQISRH